MIDRFLATRYLKGGRGPVDVDCYGLVRLARVELFKPWMPLCVDASPGDMRAITKAVSEVAAMANMRETVAMPGSIATAWRASLCVHVGIVAEADGRLWVLETDEPTGPCLTPISDFERRYTKVAYYAD